MIFFEDLLQIYGEINKMMLKNDKNTCLFLLNIIFACIRILFL